MKITYTDLIQRLVDLERLAEPPDPDEQGGCCSSYDRRSRYNAESGRENSTPTEASPSPSA